MATKISTRQLVYSDGSMTIAENGFLMVGRVPIGTLKKDGTIELHDKRLNSCPKCIRPTLSLELVAELAVKHGV